jgi:hypothetical protein
VEHLDKLIPLVILAAVGALLVFLVRRVARDADAAPRAEETVARVEVKSPPVPITAIVEAPAAVVPEVAPKLVVGPMAAEPATVVPAAASIQPAAPVRRLRRKQPMPTAVQVAPAETPIQTVLGLLREKDGLAIALVLREIFAPPVSKR